MYYLRSDVAADELHLTLAEARASLDRMVKAKRKEKGVTVEVDERGVWTFASEQLGRVSVWITDETKIYPV
jgi:hypothetical protein